mgnify:CR=1 FL=1
MVFSFETLGNASIQVFRDGKPLLITDPWLKGTCYFGSWALDNPLDERQMQNAIDSEYIWISHGHPDHLHHESLELLPKGKKIFLADHYNPEIAAMLTEMGFDVTILGYRQWHSLGPDIRILTVDNENQDSILAVEAGDSLLLNLNDSPLCGEFSFFKKLARNYARDKVYVFILCAIDADMKNIVDSEGRRLTPPPHELKKGMIWRTARLVDQLGGGHFVASSSQHLYVRQDALWANDYRIVWADVKEHWSRPAVDILEPFVTVDLATGAVTRNHPSQESDFSQITDANGEDDWEEKLSEQDWSTVEDYFHRYETLASIVDFVDLSVGGERRRIAINAKRLVQTPAQKLRGIHFMVPAHSLRETAKWGYFDDLLIGNFMKTELINVSLYPEFTPRIAKLGGNAKVLTNEDLARFRWRYLRRNPYAFFSYRWEVFRDARLIPAITELAEVLHIKPLMKRIYRQFLLGDPSPG